jgi:catechol 2,3-dioxygenase-like lactoylglutathione lyase family enzyme
MPIEHLGLVVPDVDAAKAYYDEFMPLVGYQPCFGTGYRPNDWQGAQVFRYPALEAGPYSRHRVGLQHIAFLVPARADVHRVHEWAQFRGDEIIHPPRAFPNTDRTATRHSSWTRTASCWRPSVITPTRRLRRPLRA